MIAIPYLPDALHDAGTRRAHTLDVRPMLARKEEPFEIIMRTLASLADNEALHLIAPFEPRPLYDVMRARGRLVHTERDHATFHVWFYHPRAA
jgi:uncharacterized protein (DUF2249 family)